MQPCNVALICSEFVVRRCFQAILDRRPASAQRGRANISKAATQLLRGFLFDHIDKPYPTTAEKAELARATNLEGHSINNWCGEGNEPQCPWKCDVLCVSLSRTQYREPYRYTF